MKKTRSEVVLIEPVLIDEALLEIQLSLKESFEWLDNAYGKCERRKELRENQVIMIPSISAGGKDYVTGDLFPDSHKGNFSFFDVNDGEDISQRNRGNGQNKLSFGLIFWFDYRKIYPDDWGNRSIENVKKLVLDVLDRSVFLKSKIRWNKFYVREENVYKGYSSKEIDNQFYMRPFGGFRIDGDMIIELKNMC